MKSETYLNAKALPKIYNTEVVREDFGGNKSEK